MEGDAAAEVRPALPAATARTQRPERAAPRREQPAGHRPCGRHYPVPLHPCPARLGPVKSGPSPQSVTYRHTAPPARRVSPCKRSPLALPWLYRDAATVANYSEGRWVWLACRLCPCVCRFLEMHRVDGRCVLRPTGSSALCWDGVKMAASLIRTPHIRT